MFYFFGNLLLKIEPSEITPFFFNNFFGLGGGFPPGYALAIKIDKVLLNVNKEPIRNEVITLRDIKTYTSKHSTDQICH